MRYKQNQRRRDPRYFLHEVPRPRPEQLKQLRKTVYDLLNSAGVDPADISEYYRYLTKGVPAAKLQQAWTQGENAVREFVENYVSRRGRKVSRDPRQMNLGLGDIRTISQEIRTLARRSELATARRALRQHGTALEGELSIEGRNFVDHSETPDSPEFKEALSDVINKVQLEVSQGKQKDEVIKNMFLPFAVGALSATGVITVIEQIIDSANETVAAEGEGEPAEYPEELETVGDQPEDPSSSWRTESEMEPIEADIEAGLRALDAMEDQGEAAWEEEEEEEEEESLPSRVGQPMREDRTLKESNKNIYRIIREETRRLLKQRGII